MFKFCPNAKFAHFPAGQYFLIYSNVLLLIVCFLNLLSLPDNCNFIQESNKYLVPLDFY